MVTVDYVVVGAGYAGLLCGKKLIDEGFNILVFDMRQSGGELLVFSKLSDFRARYEKYIEEMEELRKEVPVERGTVIKSKPVIINSENGLKRFDARRIIVCTGAADVAPARLNVLGKRVAGIYTLDNALRLMAENMKIGNKILLATMEDEIVKIAEEQFYRLGYDVELAKLEGSINVIGKSRVEGVEIGGEKYSCDALVVYGGREPFNPLKLRGTPVGNVVTCTYDYAKVEENVKSFISKL